MYNKDGAHYFNDGEDIPKGYVDCPTKVKKDNPTKKKNADSED